MLNVQSVSINLHMIADGGELGDKVEEEKMTCPRCLKELPKRMFNASIWCDDCYCKVCYDGEKE